MKAIRIHQQGSTDVLSYEDAPLPVIADDGVLIEVHAAGTNPIDWKVRTGYSKLEILFPYVLGWDVSGVIVESRSPRFRPGDEIYGMVNFPAEGGAYAEYVTAPADHLAHKPKSIDHIHAAAVPLAALTALQAFELSKLSAGQKVLIHAAAGGVGHFAVQLAKLLKATVIATASARNIDFLCELGADTVIDYHTTPFEEVIHDVDVVLQSIGGEHGNRSLKTMKHGGFMVTLDGKTSINPTVDVQIQRMLVQPNAKQLEQLSHWIDTGKLKPVVEQVFPLTSVAEAHDHLEGGHTRGKIVLRVR